MLPRKPPSGRKSANPKPAPRARLEKPITAAAAQPTTASRPVDPATLQEVFRRFREANPEPRGELEHVNPYTLLVAVVLSAQSTDAGVNKATKALFALADTPQRMVALGEERVREHVKTLNFFNTKAKNVIALSHKLIQEHGGKVPASVEILETLPGVGRKSASVVVNIAYGQPRIAVDTHIFRVANRIPLVVTTTPPDTQEALEAVVPDAYKLNAHHWLILHGRYVCKARRPECYRCLVRDLCGYQPKTEAPA